MSGDAHAPRTEDNHGIIPTAMALDPTGHSALDRLAFLAVLVTVGFSSMLYGGVTPAGTVFIVIGGSVAATMALAGRAVPVSRASRNILITLLVFPLIGLLQLIPLPERALRILSPRAAQAYEATNLLLREAGQAPLHGSLSIGRVETLWSLLLILSMAGLGTAACLVTRSTRRRNTLLIVLICPVLVEVVLGIVQDGFTRPVRGTFIVANHFATLVAIVTALVGAQLLASHKEGRPRAPNLRFLGLATLTILLLLVLLATFSRGAVASLAMSSTIYAFTTGRMSRRTRGIILGVLVFLAAGITLTFLGGRLQSESILARIKLWNLSLTAFAGFPLTGSGLGAFGEAIQSTAKTDGVAMIEHAHNGVLQVLVTAGLPGLLAMAVLGLLLTSALFPHARKGEARDGWATGALIAGWTFALHSMVEFSASIPAVMATLTVVLGAGLAAVEGNRDVRFGE